MRTLPPTGAMGILTRPWFVLAIVVTCFGILTPKIFIPLFRQMLGLTMGVQEQQQPPFHDRVPPPNMRMNRGGDFGRPGPRHHSSGQDTAATTTGSKSMLNFLLPVYAIGIGMYMFYTLFKVFSGKKEEENLTTTLNDSDFEESIKKTSSMTFKEKRFAKAAPSSSKNVVWDQANGEFKVKQSFHQKPAAPRSEESEDEANDYARYRDLDPEYVAYLKQRRRVQKRERLLEHNKNLREPLPNGEASRQNEIEVTPNIGLTSITNTNVLMNETLERMKFSLNKINLQLLDAEKKGSSLEDPDLDALRLQLAQTEMQMGKIMTIVNTFSDSIERGEQKLARRQQRAYDGGGRGDFSEEEEDEDLLEQIFQADADNEFEEEEEEEDELENEAVVQDLAAEEKDDEYDEDNFEDVKIRYRGVKQTEEKSSSKNQFAENQQTATGAATTSNKKSKNRNRKRNKKNK